MCTTKRELFDGKRYTKKLLYTKLQLQMPLHVSTQLRIVTPPCFRENPFYGKLTTFSTAQETKIQIKPVADPKSTLKMNMKSSKTVFRILLMSAIICNILKTTKARKFIQTIKESTYKVVLGTYNLVALTRSVFLSKAVEF